MGIISAIAGIIVFGFFLCVAAVVVFGVIALWLMTAWSNFIGGIFGLSSENDPPSK